MVKNNIINWAASATIGVISSGMVWTISFGMATPGELAVAGVVTFWIVLPVASKE